MLASILKSVNQFVYFECYHGVGWYRQERLSLREENTMLLAGCTALRAEYHELLASSQQADPQQVWHHNGGGHLLLLFLFTTKGSCSHLLSLPHLAASLSNHTKYHCEYCHIMQNILSSREEMAGLQNNVEYLSSKLEASVVEVQGQRGNFYFVAL